MYIRASYVHTTRAILSVLEEYKDVRDLIYIDVLAGVRISYRLCSLLSLSYFTTSNTIFVYMFHLTF